MFGIRRETPLSGPFGIDALALVLAFAVAAIALYVFRGSIADLSMRDADDAMRLVQVRDLIAGQGWFDIHQYRVDPIGGGGSMHWSRFIDVQILALIGLLQPLLGPEAAERWVMAIYPLALLVPLFLLFSRVLGALGDRRLVVAGLLVATTGLTFFHYFLPFRIDHHNWQLLLSVAMLWLAFGESSFRRGVVAALVITAHVEISLEGLPYLAIFAGLFAVEWLRDRAAAPRLAGFSLGLVVFPPIWLAIFRGWQATWTIYCDSFSLPYVSAVMAAGLFLLLWVRGPALWSSSWPRRLSGLTLAGGIAGGSFLLSGRSCLSGPFGQLEPLVRTHWYATITEGLPLWTLEPSAAAVSLVPTLVGLIVAFWAWRRSRHGPYGDNWARACFVFVGSALLSALVTRTGAATHALLLPAFAVLGLALWDWGRSRRTVLGRVGGGMAILLASPTTSAVLGGTAFEPFDRVPIVRSTGGGCPTAAMLKALSTQAPVRLFAPINISPGLLARTPHSVVATGHHRNHAAMNRVISAFVASPAVAEGIVRAEGSTYVVLCTPIDEMEAFAKANPDGLAARLIRSEPVDWLTFDPALSSGAFHVYRVVDPAVPVQKSAGG